MHVRALAISQPQHGLTNVQEFFLQEKATGSTLDRSWRAKRASDERQHLLKDVMGIQGQETLGDGKVILLVFRYHLLATATEFPCPSRARRDFPGRGGRRGSGKNRAATGAK